MCDIAGRTTRRAAGAFCSIPDAAASRSPPPRSSNIASACSGFTPSASPMMTIVFAEIERICASLMFWSSLFNTFIFSM
jgi:hypothetical protein